MRVFCGKARSPLQWGCSGCGREEGPEAKGGLPNLPEVVRRQIRNCDALASESFNVEGHDDLRRCPWSEDSGEGQITEEATLGVERWSRWRSLAVFPFAGSGSDQPAGVLEAIEVCEAEWIKIQNEADAAHRDALAKANKTPKKGR